MPPDFTNYQPAAAAPPPIAPWTPAGARQRAFMDALAAHPDPVIERARRIARIDALFDDGEPSAPEPTLKELHNARLDARDAGDEDYTPTANDWAELRDYLRGVS